FNATAMYKPDAMGTTGYSNDLTGLTAIAFDVTSVLIYGATSNMLIDTADTKSSTWMSDDAFQTLKVKIGPLTAVYLLSENEVVYQFTGDGPSSDITPPWAAASDITIGCGCWALETSALETLTIAAMNFLGTRGTDLQKHRVVRFFDSYLGHCAGIAQEIQASFVAGIEENAIQDLICPPEIDNPLVSAVFDVADFLYHDLDVPPHDWFEAPFWSSTVTLDYAGLAPKKILRLGDSNSDASTMFWTPSNGSFLISNSSSTPITSLPSKVAVKSDKNNPKFFCAADRTTVYVSSDSGKTYQVTAMIGSSGVGKLAVYPAKADDIWYPSSSGICHSMDFGKTSRVIPSVQSGQDIAVGKDTLSTDEGTTWETTSDAEHGFGAAGGV
ncbi:fungal cellulose binding domain-containing protein, partial [Diplocarpon rosae]